MMKFSWAISRVKWLSREKTNVSKTFSVLVLRVLVWLWLGKTFCPVYTWPSPFTRQAFDRLGPVGGFIGRFAWIIVVFEQLCYRVPGPAQYEATVPVEVFVVESHLDCFLDEAVHIS
jgi:hypothetical protein